MTPENKVYLGDSVYAEFDGRHVILWTEYGGRLDNKLFLDAAVLAALYQYAAQHIWLTEAR